jgi:soluble lytic murein transglycosylase-like protein
MTNLVLSAPTVPVLDALSQPELQPFSIDEVISQAARENKLDAVLIRSIIAAESGFQSDAASDKGAVGYMQVMPATAQELGYDATDKEENILAGSKYLGVLIERYKGCRDGLQRAIAAYNAGPGLVDRYKGVPPFRETRSYVKRVMAFRSEFIRDLRDEQAETAVAD